MAALKAAPTEVTTMAGLGWSQVRWLSNINQIHHLTPCIEGGWAMRQRIEFKHFWVGSLESEFW